MDFPNDIWKIIKNYTFDYIKFWKNKYLIAIKDIPESKTIYKRWTHFPPWKNTNDIIRDEYHGVVFEDWMISRPPPNLPLISICYNIK